MKKVFKTILLLSIISFTCISCDRDNEEEGEEMDIEFKNDAGFTYTNSTITGGTLVKIGIEAETEKSKDPIIKFNISESINGADASSIYSEDLEDQDFEYDYSFTLDTVSGNAHLYTFTVTNRDGFYVQKELTITVE